MISFRIVASFVLSVCSLVSCTGPIQDSVAVASLPLFSRLGGTYLSTFNLELRPPVGSEVYVTLDGSRPLIGGSQTFQYTKPFQIGNKRIEYKYALFPTTTYVGSPYWGAGQWEAPSGVPRGLTIVRTRLVDPVGAVTFGEPQVYLKAATSMTLPIVVLFSEPSVLFNTEQGLLVAEDQNGPNAETETEIAILSNDGTQVAVFTAGVRIGPQSRQPNKTLNVTLRKEYGRTSIPSDLVFDMTAQPLERFTIRNGGSNWYSSMVNDLIAQRMAEGLNFETQKERSALLYVQGEFWGVVQITDKVDHFDFLQTRFGYNDSEKETVDIITHSNGAASEGTSDRYFEMLHFVEQATIAGGGNLSDTDLAILDDSYLDLECLLDYLAFELYSANTDWPYQNMYLWRNGSQLLTGLHADGRFRFILHDLDLAVGNEVNGTSLQENLFNIIDYYDPSDPAHGLSPYSGKDLGWPYGRVSYFFRCLLTNKSFLDRLSTRICLLCATKLRSERLTPIAEEAIAEVRPYISWHVERWGYPKSVDEWESSVAKVVEFTVKRPDVLLHQAAEFYSSKKNIEAAESPLVTLDIELPSRSSGTLRLDNSTLASMEASPSNTLAETVSIPFPRGVSFSLEAVPKPGYQFVRWEGLDLDQAKTRLTVAMPATVRAIFRKE